MSDLENYFVGIGTQRSGTTWLATQFDNHPDIGISPIKETHFWSSKFVDHQRGSVRGFQALKIRMRKLVRHCFLHPIEALRWISAYGGMMAHRESSYRKFVELGRYGAAIAGEITPAYATLPKEGFAAIDHCREKPKYLFLLRNPAERFISQIAHDSARGRCISRATSVQELLADPAFALRSRYRDTYRICQSVAGDDRLLVVFFEDLVDPRTGPASYERICKYLGVRSHPVNLTTVINSFPTPNLSFSRDEIVEALRAEYVFFDQLYRGRLPVSWLEDTDNLRPKDFNIC